LPYLTNTRNDKQSRVSLANAALEERIAQGADPIDKPIG
jgi:hypothetical protein